MTSLRRFAVLAVVPLIAFTAGCGDNTTTTPKASKAECSYSATGDAAKKVDPPSGTPAKDAPTELTIATDRGDVPVSLDADKAPCTVNSFVSLAKQGYFDNTKCHRLTNQGLFVLQCGDPSATGTGGPGYGVQDELVDQDPRLQPCQNDAASGQDVCTYTTGTLAMANSGQPDSNGSQFFLVYKDSPLPAAYTVFGRMSAAGVKVVQTIAKGGLAADGVAPRTPVTITSVK